MQQPGVELTFEENLSICAAGELMRRLQAVPGFGAALNTTGKKGAAVLPEPQPAVCDDAEDDEFLRNMDLEQLMLKTGIIEKADSASPPAEKAQQSPKKGPRKIAPKGSARDSSTVSIQLAPPASKPADPVKGDKEEPTGETTETTANADSRSGEARAELGGQLSKCDAGQVAKKPRRKALKPKKSGLFDLGFSVELPNENGASGGDETSEQSDIHIVDSASPQAEQAPESPKKGSKKIAPNECAEDRPTVALQLAPPAEGIAVAKPAAARRRKAPAAAPRQRVITLDADFLAPMGQCPFESVALSGNLQPAKWRNGAAAEGLLIKRIRLAENGEGFTNEGGLLLLNVQPGLEGTYKHEGFSMSFAPDGHNFRFKKK